MSEWKVGDKVRLVGSGWIGREEGYGVGSVVEVDGIDPEGDPMWRDWYLVTGNDSEWATERVESAGVKRSDISLKEAVVIERPFVFVQPPTIEVTHWEAELHGSLPSGEGVGMIRYGSTAQEALNALETAIAEQGWTIEEGL